MIRIVATLAEDAPDIHTVAQHPAACGRAVECKMAPVGAVDGYCFRDTVDPLRLLKGMAGIEEEAVVWLGARVQ